MKHNEGVNSVYFDGHVKWKMWNRYRDSDFIPRMW